MFLMGRKFLSVGCCNKSSVNTLPVTEWEIVTKGKLHGVREHVKYWIMSATSKETIHSAVFHLYLKYQNKIAMMKLISIKFPHLNPTSHHWPNVKARLVLIFCYHMCWNSLVCNFTPANKSLFGNNHVACWVPGFHLVIWCRSTWYTDSVTQPEVQSIYTIPTGCHRRMQK